ncbi:MAG TPA: tetratricopeptide repeat protein [Sphingomicrobium sp.]
MTTPFRFGSAISLVALATAISGCAAPHGRTATLSIGGKASAEVGLATKALMALNANDPATAITYAEQAVQAKADDFTMRALLGNAYFAAGRFASAEAAYKDSLSLFSNQPHVVLKLALAQIAQGKSGEAVAYLDAARNVLEPADYGLALALAGRTPDALAVLQTAAREQGADARVRQNLALAYAFAGDWTNAKIVAAQDVPADQLDARIQQWMKLSKPVHASDQVAALIGVSPAASDPGQPTRLALRGSDGRLAQATPAPAPVAAAPAQVAEAAPPVETFAPASVPTPSAAVDAAPPPPPVAFNAPAITDTPAFAAVPPAPPPPRKASVVRHASSPAERLPLRNAILRRDGHANAVVQLGAYGNPERVAAAWTKVANKYGALKGYTPMSARFASAKGTVYRLSVKGFSSVAEAQNLCASLKRAGGSCFVRNVAGDTPVQIASR